MKLSYTISIVLALALLSCSKNYKEVEVVKQMYPDHSKQFTYTYKVAGEDSIPVLETEYYPSGNTKMQGPLDENGLRTGNWKAWFDDGKLWVNGYFSEDKNDGKRTVYFENGQKRMETEYTNGNPSGTWRFWDETGKEIKVINH